MKKLLIKKWNGLAVWMLRKTGAWDNIITELIRITEKSIKLEIEKKKAENDEKEFDNLPAYTKRAIELVKGHDSLEVSGESKRHSVYSKLIKEFPEVPKRDLGLSVEVGVQRL